MTGMFNEESTIFDSQNSTTLDNDLQFSREFNLSITSGNASSNISTDEPSQGTDKVFWALLLVPLPLVAVVGNILVILSVYREKSLQTVTNYFIVSLAFADLLVAAVVMPFAVYVLVNVDWELNDMLCDFYIAVDVTCSTASIFNLVAISIDRYIAVTQPIKYSKHKNSKRVSLTIAIVWVVSAAIGSPIVLGLNTSPERVPQLCVFYNSDFIIYSSLSSFYIPCIVMIFLYYKIFKAIHERAKKNQQRAARQQSSSTLTEGGGKGRQGNTTMSSTIQLQVLVEKDDGATINTGSGSQQDEDDFSDTQGDEKSSSKMDILKPGTSASAMLLGAFVTETIRIEIPINGNMDSGYGTSHVEQETQLGLPLSPIPKLPEPSKRRFGNRLQKRNGDVGRSVGEEPTTSTKKKSRFNLGRRHKSSRKKREKASAKRERKATKTLAIVLGMFLMCWVPFFTCNILDAICIKLENDTWRPGVTLFLLTTWLGYVNSCVNPVIYTIFNMEFRKAFKKLLSDVWVC